MAASFKSFFLAALVTSGNYGCSHMSKRINETFYSETTSKQLFDRMKVKKYYNTSSMSLIISVIHLKICD